MARGSMNILLSVIIIIAILCIAPAMIFFLGGRLFGATKEKQWQGFKRSALGIIYVFGIAFILPSFINLALSFLRNVVSGSMTLNEYLKHIDEFSLRATYNFYTQLFSRLAYF